MKKHQNLTFHEAEQTQLQTFQSVSRNNYMYAILCAILLPLSRFLQ